MQKHAQTPSDTHLAIANEAIKKTAVNYYAIVLSAGVGKRFSKKTAKQYHRLAGKTVLEHSVATIGSTLDAKKTLLVHSKTDTTIQSLPFEQAVDFVLGGQERMHSVFNALKALHGQAIPQDFVLIHDGARPCLRNEDLLKLINATKDHPVGGVLATPITSTIKKTNTDLVIQKTISRNNLWAVQTPQLLRFGLLYKALEHAIANELHVTDDASALELQNHYPLVVHGSKTNIKITHPEDLSIAEMFLKLF